MKELTGDPYNDGSSDEYGDEGFEVIHNEAKHRDDVCQCRRDEPLPNEEQV
jgi:hypothetical protein